VSLSSDSDGLSLSSTTVLRLMREADDNRFDWLNSLLFRLKHFDINDFVNIAEIMVCMSSPLYRRWRPVHNWRFGRFILSIVILR
jgi:hypothetical protein